ncbi:copper amine oxidase N-terminal domain-containing protein [Herbivorax sp. ANBcel31]|uniref:copper amine oxidase N-terminal domain-containing protein n=1 Tax=Herbivorax sp. ANBcel31 TaxID=3069754 RepID=UPI0027AEB834|nr:copper amine oxidase N-terminal domain-containing protein [Herbivorax sp. ANBcel31]MDQ2086554.1 copper amine oxidase N-terminal domain-containing protein [Herbivorax sp. ANBcel31]
MKRLSVLVVFSIVCLLCFNMFIFTNNVSANPDDITIIINGETMEFGTDANDPYPYIKDGRTLIPFRRIFEELDMDVTWDGDTRTVYAKNETTEMELGIGKQTAIVNDEEHTLDVAPEITDDRTFVPLRFVSESVGADVGWDHDTRVVTISFMITSPVGTIPGIDGPTDETYSLGEQASYGDRVFTVDSISGPDENNEVIITGTTNLNVRGMLLDVFYSSSRTLTVTPIYNKNDSNSYDYFASYYNYSNQKPKYILVKMLQDDGTYKTVTKYDL